MNDAVRFNASNSYRVCMALGGCLMSILVLGLFGGYMSSSMYGVPLGTGIALYFTYPAYFVKSDSLVFKFGFSKVPFLFTQGPFRVERLNGAKSYLQSFRPQSYVLRITGAKNRAVNIALSDQDFAVLLKLLRERGAVIEGDTAELL